MVTVYGQTEVTKDLIDANLAAGVEIVFEAHDVDLHDVSGQRPQLSYNQGRPAIPPGV